MKRLLYMTLVCLLTTAALADDCRLQGVWKSDAARTLSGIDSTKMTDASALNAISHGLFGHMTHEWTCTGFREWFDTQNESITVAYEILSDSDSATTLEVLTEPEYVLSLAWEGECYKLPVAGHDFYEYFCPVD